MKTQSIRSYSLLAALVFAGVTLFAQNSKRTTAYNYMRDGELAKAVEPINAAAQHENTRDDEKTWRYRGDIYLRIAASQDKELKAQFPDAVEKAFQSYMKSEELDDKDRYDEERQRALNTVNQLALNEGVADFNAKDYEAASGHFKTAMKSKEELGVKDTLAIYNAGLSYENTGKLDSAIVYYKEAAKLDYLGPKLYLYIANIYQKQDKGEEYLAIINKGLEKYPEDANLNLYRLNYYLRNEKFDEALTSLNKAIEKDPENKTLHFSLGAVHEELGNIEKAKNAYKEAIAIDSTYFDANYNLGAMIFNQGVEMNNAANEIEDNAKYEEKRAEARDVFRSAKPHLEKAHSLQPDNVNTIQSLMQLYAFIGENDKYKEMKSKLEEQTGQSKSGSKPQKQN